MGDTAATVGDAVAAIRAGTIGAEELVRNAAETVQRLEPRLAAFAEHWFDRALTEARAADRRTAHRGPLHGIPIAVKDVIHTREAATRAGSRAADPSWGRRDAASVAALRAAGAIIVGKTSTMELAVGLPDPDGPFPVPRNPWELDRWAGGSSSGSASAVATGGALAALGSDTGGSIRLPAAYCGITGFKPTYGAVDTDGLVPLSTTLDHIGPMARTAEDCALLFSMLTGRPLPRVDLDGVRIGVVPGTAFPAPSGWRTVEVDLPDYTKTKNAHVVIMRAEAITHHRQLLRDRSADLTPGTLTTLYAGEPPTTADLDRARRIRTATRARLAQLFERVDLIVTPTCTTVAPLVADLGTDFARLREGLNTAYWNMVGNPALSVPAGFRSGLPVALQIAGRPGDDALVLAAGAAYQREIGWSQFRPPLG